MALLSSSIVLFMLVAFFPFMRMEAAGLTNQISVIEAVFGLWVSGYPWLAFACTLLILVFPMLRILLSILVGAQLLQHRPMTTRLRSILATNQAIAPWAMTEIFMLGVVVSLVKVGALADIHLGAAFWAMGALTVTMSLGFSALCADTLWSRARANL